MKTKKIVFDKTKTYIDLDQELKEIYAAKEQVIIEFDIRQMRNTGLFRLLKYKPIFEKYRPMTKEYLVRSVIYVHNLMIKNIIIAFLKILKPEKPTKIICN